MNRVDVTLSLPEELVEQAKSVGVLTNERIAAWLEAEIKRQSHAQQLQETLRRLRSVEPSLTQDEIDDEIAAYRSERNQSG